MGLVLLPALYAGCSDYMLFPVFVLRVKLVVALDMFDQGTVPISKILPPLVAVRLALKDTVNAERGFVIACLCRICCIQTGKQRVGLMQRHLLAVL